MNKIQDEFSHLSGNKAYYRRYKKKGRHLLWAARRRAKKFNLPLNITIEDVAIPDYCPILGIPLDLHIEDDGQGRKLFMNSPSLDKIKPELGYVKGNVRVISFKANKYKSDMSRETVQRLLNYMDGKL